MNISSRSLGHSSTHIEKFQDPRNGNISTEINYQAFNPNKIQTNFNFSESMKQKELSISLNNKEIIDTESQLMNCLNEMEGILKKPLILNHTQFLENNLAWFQILKIGFFELNKINKLPCTINKSVLGKNPNSNESISHYRTEQAWIENGNESWNPKMAEFVPPHHEAISNLMSDWLEFYKSTPDNPYLWAGILYYQFMIIHPFINGNERTCNALILFFLFRNRILNKGFFFIATEIRRNRMQNNMFLKSVALYGSWEQWLIHFLDCLSNCIEITDIHQGLMFKDLLSPTGENGV